MQVQTAENKKIVDASLWVDRHGDFLFALALSRVRDESVAEDIVRETLLAAFASDDFCVEKSAERTWLNGILKQKIIDHFRRNCEHGDLTAEEAEMSSYQYLFADETWADHWSESTMPSDWQTTPEKALEKGEFCAVLEHCLGELPERVANCFTLREMDGFEGAEICGILNVSMDNYRLMMHRARTHLRRCLEFDWFKKVNF